MAVKNILKVLLLSAVLVSCTDSDERFTRKYPCKFKFDMALHPTSALTRCLDNPTMFVRVDVKRENGVFVFYVYPNSGKDNERIMLGTDKENYLVGQVGANNSIIVGASTFNGHKAYDAQCPNCLDMYSGSSFPLAFSQNGQTVSCKNCSRTYQLNTDGITDNGLRLLEYRVRVEFDQLGNKKALWVTN